MPAESPWICNASCQFDAAQRKIIESRDLIDRSVVPAMQQAMSRDAGGLRDAAGLDRLCPRTGQAGERQIGAEPGLESWEATNLMTVATAIVASARLREESRGAHWRDDFEGRREPWHGHLIARTRCPVMASDTISLPPCRSRQMDSKPLMIYTKLAEIAEARRRLRDLTWMHCP